MRVSVVTPAKDEHATIRQLLERLHALDFDLEIIVVDDASDTTFRKLLDELEEEGLCKVIHLSSPQGQLKATLTGLRVTEGEIVVVMDSDLQHPPEVIPRLIDLLEEKTELDAVFAKETTPAYRAIRKSGHKLYHLILKALGPRYFSSHATSFGAMRQKVATRVARLDLSWGNVGALLALIQSRIGTVEYEKPARSQGDSRLGLKGLAKEALGTFFLTGVLHRACALAGLLTIPLPFVGSGLLLCSGVFFLKLRRLKRKVLSPPL